MNKINTKEWKDFIVGELFQCDTTFNIPSKNDLKEGKIPYITRSSEKNGLSGYCGNTEKINKGNCITIGAEGFFAFYQKDDFVAGNKVYTIRHDKITKYSAYFIVSCLNVLSSNYSFNNARVLEKIKQEIIKLPVDKNGDLDREYMEDCMKKLEEKCKNELRELESVMININKKIDTNLWKSFRVGDFFNIRPTKAYKLTNAKLLDGGIYPVVVNSAFNNGIGGYTTNKPTEKGNMITFSDTVDANTIFYQEKDFVGYAHVQGLYPYGEYRYKWNKKTLQFFCSCFRKSAFIHGFDYGNKFRRDIAVNLNIILPVDNEGTPNREYMESYMKNLMEKNKEKLNCLN